MNRKINHKLVYNLLPKLKIISSILKIKQGLIVTIRNIYTNRLTLQSINEVSLLNQLKLKVLNINLLLQILASMVIKRNTEILTGLLSIVRLVKKLLILKNDKKLQLKRSISILYLGYSKLQIGAKHLSMKCL